MTPRPHYCASVREFHLAFGCAAPLVPTSLDDQTRFARIQLEGEELSELTWGLAANDMIECWDALADIEYVLCGSVVATGYDLMFGVPHMSSAAEGPPRMPHPDAVFQAISMMYEGLSAHTLAMAENDPARIAQIAGAMLVSLGHLWGMFGVSEPLRMAFNEEVHESNMTKFGADGKPVVNEAGRVVKGPNFREPDLLGVARRFLGADWTPPPLRTSCSTPLSGAPR